MIPRTLIFLFLLPALSAIAGTPQNPLAKEPAPPSPFIAKGACPFERCTYREWTAKRDISLVDQPNGEKIVAELHKGQKVQGVTGEVHSIPLRTTATRDDPATGLKAGDVIYVLHYEGEGMFKAWRNGKLIDTDDVHEKGLRSTWWVQIKTASGVVGWAVSRRNFDGQDACG